MSQGQLELDQEKLSDVLRLKWRALPDAFAKLGHPDLMRRLFVGSQRHLYEGRPSV
ncbi:MAG: hypothetical protein ABI589_09855 [Burkholderiales bacterium]